MDTKNKPTTIHEVREMILRSYDGKPMPSQEEFRRVSCIAVAKWLNLKPLDLTDTDRIKIDGLSNKELSGEIRRFDPMLEFSYNDLTEKVGTYQQHNGVITYVDESGYFYITPLTNKTLQMFKAAGYIESSLYDMVGNGQSFVDEAVATKWQDLKDRASAERDREEEEARVAAELAKRQERASGLANDASK
jgi:hypothetical protein